jgi:hypothetical protein
MPDDHPHDEAEDDADPEANQVDEPMPAVVEEEEEEDLGRETAVTRLAAMPDLGYSSIELDKIPRRFWEQTLAPLTRQQRTWLAGRIADPELRDVAMQLAFELDMAECQAADAHARARHAALRTGHPLPSPSPAHASARSSVQVNLRLRRDDHERLTHAATAVGLKPTTLARSLVLNGAAMILREHGREHLAPPARPIYTPLSLD